LKLLNDVSTVFERELRPTMRDPISPVITMAQPLVFLLLFGPLLSGMTGTGGATPWQWFVPGILVMMALVATGMTGYNLLLEMQTSSHERMMVTPLGRSSMLVGRALKEMAPISAQAVVIVVAVLPFGFRLYPLGALAGLVLLAGFGVGMGALSYALAIASSKQEWIFYTVQQTLPFPLLIHSGTMLPLESGPSWMQLLYRINPLTYVVEAERALFAGDFSHPSVPIGALATLAMAAVGPAVGTRAMRRSAD
jgi:ABC-2 type transport system permease protein